MPCRQISNESNHLCVGPNKNPVELLAGAGVYAFQEAVSTLWYSGRAGLDDQDSNHRVFTRARTPLAGRCLCSLSNVDNQLDTLVIWCS
jgi:hypothetical protein